MLRITESKLILLAIRAGHSTQFLVRDWLLRVAPTLLLIVS